MADSLSNNATGYKENGIYRELHESQGVYTYYYQDYNNNEVIVISSSEEAGLKGVYNDGISVYEIDMSNLDISVDNYFKDEFQFEKLINEIANNKSEISF